MSKKRTHNIEDPLLRYINDSIGCLYELRKQSDEIKEVADIIKNSNQIYVCGNGGSAATASHFANDIQKICRKRAYSLTDNTPIMTAWANDLNYDNIFMKQLENIATEDDTLIVISGSGNSPNLFNAVTYANSTGMNTIGFVGMDGGRLKKNVKLTKLIHVETDMLHSEDWHLTLCHLISYLIKNE